MKEFTYPNGHKRYTMTVKELREQLTKYPDDMPVFGGWEGVTGFITPGGFDIEPVNKRGEQCEALVIDVEDYL